MTHDEARKLIKTYFSGHVAQADQFLLYIDRVEEIETCAQMVTDHEGDFPDADGCLEELRKVLGN